MDKQALINLIMGYVADWESQDKEAFIGDLLEDYLSEEQCKQIAEEQGMFE